MNIDTYNDFMNTSPIEESNCRHKNCKCEKKLSKLKQLKQGDTNICWFVSVLNMLLFSDEISTQLKNYNVDIKNIIKKCQNIDNLYYHIKNELSKQVCAPNKVHENLLKLRNLESIKNEKKSKYFSLLFDEFISYDSNTKLTEFQEIDFLSGGIPFNIYIKYLSLLGYDINTIRHIVMDFNKIFENTVLEKYNPRQFKMCRLFSDYLRTYIFCNPLKIFICTVIQEHKINIKKLKNDYMYFGKYICILEELTNGQLYFITYILDCGIIGAFNKKGMSHAISMITCNTKGYIINSFNDNDKKLEENNPLKSCGVYKYNWFKWDNNDFYYHKINHNNKCMDASIINKEQLLSIYDENGYNKEDDFCYNKNTGLCNSHFYVKIDEKIINRNKEIDNIHSNKYFNSYLKPYIYLLYDEINKYNKTNLQKINISINFIDIQPGFSDIDKNLFTIIQPGIIKENMILYHYQLLVHNNLIEIINFIGEMLFNYLTDDIMIIYHKNTNIFSILIEYTRYDDSSITKTSLFSLSPNKKLSKYVKKI